MNIKKAVFSENEKAEIISALKGTHPSHVYKRLMALKLKALDGKSSIEAGEAAGLHPTSVNRIISRYQQEGIESITGKRHNHGKRYMTGEEEETFLSGFQNSSDAGHVIETRVIRRAFEETIGHPVAKSTIYYILHKHGWRKVMPRSRHEKKASEEAIEAYKKNRRRSENSQKGAAKASRDVSGRGWVRADQQT